MKNRKGLRHCRRPIYEWLLFGYLPWNIPPGGDFLPWDWNDNLLGYKDIEYFPQGQPDDVDGPARSITFQYHWSFSDNFEPSGGLCGTLLRGHPVLKAVHRIAQINPEAPNITFCVCKLLVSKHTLDHLNRYTILCKYASDISSHCMESE